jgi:hypothetical protein
MQHLLRISLVVAAATLLQSCSDASESSAPDAAFAGTASPSGGNNPPRAGVMTAGEWSDLNNWSFWQNLREKPEWAAYEGHWQFYTSSRYTITLTDQAGQPLADARVSLGLTPATTGVTAAVTNRQGRAELFPALFVSNSYAAPLTLHVTYQGRAYTPDPVEPTEHRATRALPVGATPTTPVDIMFVVDATGSMGDEINYLKAELHDVITRADAQLPAADLRMASVFYRDHGDEYLTRTQPFTNNVNQLLTFVRNQQAGGGGDFPEAVDEALNEAFQQQWSTEARCRLLFLVLDAPPHDRNKARIQQLTRQAAQRGIRIVPVTASGINRTTEFLMRGLAMSTGGTYVFITGHSGIGDPHLEASVGPYQVEYLNNLLVRLITEYSQ